MLHGLVINWSNSAIETSRNRVNVFSFITVIIVLIRRMLGKVAKETLGIACGVAGCDTYGAIRAENQDLLTTISELKTRLEKVEKGMNATSRVRRPMSRDSHVAHSVLDNSKKAAKNVADYVVQIVLWVVDSGCSKHMMGLGHNLFSVGQFCDGDLEVAFRSNTCYVRNLEGDDFLTGRRDSNLYTISIYDMAASSPVCLMSKATSTKSWLWHRRLSHLNFGTINDLTRLDLVDGLPKFKWKRITFVLL
ncbi:integrase, catalytic region, zinc finger, CCHC-type containing protein [Tanacetum coccineum]|uniref:Integrase, catalytic region, zinc finger, CCHC-type containing protein n=1 Tax=Tanacetum coccineum TaxID=301880 RepID=A0ABQ5FA49_9ASTR